MPLPEADSILSLKLYDPHKAGQRESMVVAFGALVSLN